ncbi:MAG: squalene/phytoene synthase family protein, partial [Candidatus Hydrogenedentes bacterium]|nr:squalene/phytoene synthase family protein [Candidatus Hydrogenedentota bacterium]
VGEMLTELFCAHSPAIAPRREALSRLAVSFGQGLQMTNILKDIWDDKNRGVCWLPQSVFQSHGFDLADLSSELGATGFEAGLEQLIGIARGHLDNALAYTLLIPKEEAGVRRFCLWAIGMAILTLRKISANRTFRSGAQVKISRRSVKATIAVTQLFGWSNRLLGLSYRLVARGLPHAPSTMRRN